MDANLYADSFQEAHKAPKVDPKGVFDPSASLFDENEDLGEGSSPSDAARQAEAELMAIMGPRLRKARKLAGFTESTAGLALAHRGVTQVSLFENSRRAPSLNNLRRMAKLYCVQIDYLMGLHDDIGRAPEEGNQAVLCGVMAEAVSGEFQNMIQALATRSAIMLEGFSLDRVLLGTVATKVVDLMSALEVMCRQPEFEDVRGGAKVVRLVGELHVTMQDHSKRVKREQMAHDEVEPVAIAPEVVKEKIRQMLLFG